MNFFWVHRKLHEASDFELDYSKCIEYHEHFGSLIVVPSVHCSSTRAELYALVFLAHSSFDFNVAIDKNVWLISPMSLSSGFL